MSETTKPNSPTADKPLPLGNRLHCGDKEPAPAPVRMHRSLAILSLSVALTVGPIDIKSSMAHNTASESVQSEKSSLPQTVENHDNSKPASNSAVKGSKPEAKKTTGANGSNDSVAKPKPGRKTRARSATRGLTRVQMQNVDFHVDDTIVLRIRNLRGALLRTNKATPPVFENKESFNFRIDSGTVGISAASLADLLNNYVFAYPDAPLKEVSISIEGNQIKMTGTIHKVTDLSFEIVGDLLATPEGKIRLHPTSIKTIGVPVKGLMNLFGIELEGLIKSTESRGVKIDDNDITMDPEVMIPAPGIRGKITAVRIEGDEVIQVFGPPGTPASVAPSRRRGPNYMSFRGGTVRFGKMTMTNADLRLVDQDPKTPFGFSMDHYNRQLVAGYSKNTRTFGVVVYMPDYSRVQGTSARATSRGVTVPGPRKP